MGLSKPFDMKNLEERLTAQGLPAVEGLAEIASKEVLAWAQESCLIHDNVFVKSAGSMAIEALKPIVAGLVDKIDGEVG